MFALGRSLLSGKLRLPFSVLGFRYKLHIESFSLLLKIKRQHTYLAVSLNINNLTKYVNHLLKCLSSLVSAQFSKGWTKVVLSKMSF